MPPYYPPLHVERLEAIIAVCGRFLAPYNFRWVAFPISVTFLPGIYAGEELRGKMVLGVGSALWNQAPDPNKTDFLEKLKKLVGGEVVIERHSHAPVLPQKEIRSILKRVEGG